MSVLDRVKRVNARGEPEESVAFRVFVLVAVMAAALAVLAQGVGGGALRAGVVVGLPAAFWFSWWGRYRTGFWLKVGLAAGVLAAFARFLAAVKGVQAGTFADLQMPLAELFVWVQLLHALDVPARRDLLFSLVSSAVLAGVAGVLSVSSGLALFLLVWAVAAAAALVLGHRSRVSRLRPLVVDRVGGPAAAGGRIQAAGRPGRVARLVGTVVVVVAVVAGSAFLVVPSAGRTRAFTYPARLPSVVPLPIAGALSNPALGDGDPGRQPGSAARAGRRGGRGGRAGFGYLGFSTELDTSARGRPDHTVVMRVRSNRTDLWRGQTFDAWDGRRWTMSDQQSRAIGSADLPMEVPPVDRPTGGDWQGGAGQVDAASGAAVAPVARAELTQTFYVARPGPNLIFGAAEPSKLYFPDRRVFQLSDGTLRAGVPLGEGAIYTVVSDRALVTPDRLRAAGVSRGAPGAIAVRYAKPPVTTARVRQLASAVAGSAPSTYDAVLVLEHWLAVNTRYTLDVAPLPDGADAVDRFLFVDRRGFCEQIGTSLVVMLRSLGVPARLVTGYAPGERNPFTGLYEVRASDAHAWAEVWFPGVGWQGFDPTASVPLAGEESDGRASSGLAAWLARRVPVPPAWVWLGIFVGGGAALVLVVGWRMVDVRRRRAGRAGSAASRGWAVAAEARLERAGAASGRPRRSGETLSEYAAALGRTRLADPRLPALAAAITRDAFAVEPADPDTRAAADTVLADLRQRVSERLQRTK